MTIDYGFIADSLERYAKHLQDVRRAIEGNLHNYETQEAELKRLVSFKPQTYTVRYEEIQEKKKEADIKLSHVVPRLDKIYEQLEEIRKMVS